MIRSYLFESKTHNLILNYIVELTSIFFMLASSAGKRLTSNLRIVVITVSEQHF